MPTPLRSRVQKAIAQRLFDYSWNHFARQRHTNRPRPLAPLTQFLHDLNRASYNWDDEGGLAGMPVVRQQLVDLAQEYGLTVSNPERSSDADRRSHGSGAWYRSADAYLT